MILDMEHRDLGDGIKSIRLGEREASVFCALSHSHRTLTHQSLISHVYDDVNPGDTNALRTLISRIRRRTVQAGWGKLIETDWHNGFFLSNRIDVINQLPPVMIPGIHKTDLENLLYSHPNRIVADKILGAIGCARWYGQVTLDVEHRELRDKDHVVRLSKRECSIIELLAACKNYMTITKIIKAFWPKAEPPGANGNIRVQVCNIRKKVSEAGLPPIIGERSARGYILACPIDVINVATSMTTQKETQ